MSISGAKLYSKIEKYYKKKIYILYKVNTILILQEKINTKSFIVPVIDENDNVIDYISFKHKKDKNNFFHKFPIIIMAGGEGTRMSLLQKSYQNR